MIPVNEFKGLKISIASSEDILSWSYGEVTKPETINYRTLKPEKDGLFCEKIFGPTKDYECNCGKYKRVRYKNIVCDRCGVEITSSKVRRERMGHIKLAAPVSHIWFFKGVPSRMGLILDMSPRELEEVLYFVSYIVTDPGDTPLELKQVLAPMEYMELKEKYGDKFKAAIGAEAIQDLLKQIDLEELRNSLIDELEESKGQKRKRLLKKVDTVNDFYQSQQRPENMIIDVLPVIPPDLRPMIQLDGGRFAASDLNDLYRRIINRNNRLKKLIDLNAPIIIIQNEKRMLQEAVDALFDNGRRGRNITGAGNRPLKSLSSLLKGKQGRFRQNLLGKRVDYSGRSVIVVGPTLEMHQCGLPKEMAIELFKPHVINGLVKKGLAHNIKAAKRIIDRRDEVIWDIVDEVIAEYPVLLNRAPTLHRLGIQAFEPKLIGGKAIQLHPLACTAFNADFDGDQMPVHVPLSEAAKGEARLLMNGANNILNPKDGEPIITPSQDMVLGNYYITMEKAGVKGEGRVFKDVNDVISALDRKEIDIHARIAILPSGVMNKKFLEEQMKMFFVTTPGKILFNESLPEEFQYISEATNDNITKGVDDKFFIKRGANIPEEIKKMELNKPFTKKDLQKIIAEVFKRYRTGITTTMLDKMKNLGFKYSTLAGVTISIHDVIESENKYDLIEDGSKKVALLQKQFNRGLITEEERYNKVLEIWAKVKNDVQQDLEKIAEKNNENPIIMMMKSGARGKIANFTQLAGMRGLMSRPNGKQVEVPIQSSFKEGLSVGEFFLSTHGSRKSLSDTALKTADSGYLTRRLVDVSQNIIITEKDCGTLRGTVIKPLINEKTGEVIENLFDRIVGRFSNQKIIHPKTKELIVDKGEYITDDIAELIVDSGFEEIEIRSTLTCGAKNGLCQKCYGRNLATGAIVDLGEAVGVIAAQAIGEPGTQLTMRTFHTGGVSGVEDITEGLPRVEELFEARDPRGEATIAEISGKVQKIEENKVKDGQIQYKITIQNDLETKEHLTSYNPKVIVKVKDVVEAGDKLTEGPVSPKKLLKVTDAQTAQEYILKEVQFTYRGQGVDISDKHIEIITKQMVSKLSILDEGDTDMYVGSNVSFDEFRTKNKEAIKAGKKPAEGKPIMLGITNASLETDSFLAAASFQETTRVLTEAAVGGKVDYLHGLKENVLIGKIIPAGTGALEYQNTSYKLAQPILEGDVMDNLEMELMD